jgi:hypothetical protein
MKEENKGRLIKVEKEVDEVKKSIVQVEGVTGRDVEEIKKEVGKIRLEGEGLTKQWSKVVEDGGLERRAEANSVSLIKENRDIR